MSYRSTVMLKQVHRMGKHACTYALVHMCDANS